MAMLLTAMARLYRSVFAETTSTAGNGNTYGDNDLDIVIESASASVNPSSLAPQSLISTASSSSNSSPSPPSMPSSSSSFVDSVDSFFGVPKEHEGRYFNMFDDNKSDLENDGWSPALMHFVMLSGILIFTPVLVLAMRYKNLKRKKTAANSS